MSECTLDISPLIVQFPTSSKHALMRLSFLGIVFVANAVSTDLSSSNEKCAGMGRSMIQRRSDVGIQLQIEHSSPVRQVQRPEGMESVRFLQHLAQQAPPHLASTFNNMAVNLGAGDGRAFIPGLNCSIGLCDGPENDPVYPLYNSLHFGGLAVDGDPAFEQLLNENLPWANVTKLISMITPINVVSLLKEGNIPIDMDFFKNDIDGYDCAVSFAVLVAGYRPKIIQVEVNPEIPYPIAFGVNYDKELKQPCFYDGFYGCSLTLTSSIIKRFGYQLVGTPLLHDAIYVRDDFMVGLEPLTDEAASKELGKRSIEGHTNHMGYLYVDWLRMTEEVGGEKTVENVTAEVTRACGLSQGTLPTCSVPFTVSLNPEDYLVQLSSILAQPDSV